MKLIRTKGESMKAHAIFAAKAFGLMVAGVLLYSAAVGWTQIVFIFINNK